MTQNHSAFICDAVRTPFGRYGGALAGVRTDDLAKRYTEKIVSRLLGACQTLHFVGDDIRLLDK